MPEEKQEKYLRLKDVCRIYDVNKRVVYRLVRAKKIPYGKFSNILLFPKNYLEWWLRGNKEEALAEWFNYELCPKDMEDNNDSQEDEERKLVSRLLY